MAWEPAECETLDDLSRMQHEYYTSLVGQGFTEHEAMHVLLNQACCAKGI